MDISFVTRKFQRSIAGLGLAAILATSVVTGSAFALSYSDVSSDFFAADQIDALSDAGIMTGYANGNFGPNDTLTREQAAKILVLAFATVDEDAEVTCDGMVSDWAVEYMATANLLGILEGDGNGDCRSTDPVSRAEMAKMTVTAAMLANDGTMASDWFSDVVDGAWYDEYMGTAYVYGVMGGYTNGKMGPGDSVTRGQAAKMTYNAMYPVYNPPSSGDDDDDDVVTEGGDLEIILSDESAEDYTYFSAGTNAEVAAFEVTASDEDVLVTSFEVELASGDSDSILALALYNEEGTRISKVDTSIDSDDMARLTMLDGGYTVEEGTSEIFRLVNTFEDGPDDNNGNGNDANTSTLYSYAFDSSMIESNAGSVEVENDLRTGIFGLLDNDTGAVTVSLDEVPSEVQVGETDAVIASFEIAEDSGEDKDVWLWAITLQNDASGNLEDAVDDLALYFDGDWVADGTQYGDYISFQMDEETAPMIEAGNTESFEVRARIIGESGEQLNFFLEESLDVRATDEDDNDVAVVNDFPYVEGNAFDIEAGAVSVVAYDAESDSFRADREDVELGRFEVTAGTDGLTLTDINLDITVTDGTNDATNVSDLLENISVEVNGANQSMDLSSAAGLTETYSLDIDKSLEEGTVYEFVVYADTFSIDDVEDNTGDTSIDYTEYTVEIALDDLGTGASTDGLVVEEDATGDQVTDFTPSSVSFNQLDGETAGVDISALSLSSSKDAVVGSDDILALEFEVEEDADVSDLTIKDLDVNVLYDTDGAGGDYESASNSNINSVDFYMVNDDDTETLLDSVSGSQLGSTSATDGTTVNLDFSDITVAQGEANTFRVYVSFVDDTNLNGDEVSVQVSGYDIRDDENNEVFDAQDTDSDGDFTDDTMPTSGRTITLVSTGTLYIDVDNDDTTYGTESKRWLLAGAEDQGLMSIEVRAENEDVVIEEYTLTLASAEDGLSDYFESISIYNEDGILVGNKTLSDETTTVSFDSAATELTAYEGETVSYYFVADLLPFGEDFAGEVDSNNLVPASTLSFSTDVVRGSASNDVYAEENADGDTTIDPQEVIYGTSDNGGTGTAVSETFDVVATLISEVAFVTSAPTGEDVDDTLTGGENTVAILSITTEDTDNTQADGTDIETILNALDLNIYFDPATTLNGVRLELLGTSSEAEGTVPVASGDPSEFDIAGDFSAIDTEIDPGETIYLAVIADVTLDGTADGEYIQVKVDDINTAWIDWDDSATSGGRTTVYMGTQTRLTAVKVSEDN